MSSRFPYQSFHESISNPNELEYSNVIAPRYDWVFDKYKYRSQKDNKIHDISVNEPYQWLEDPDSKETKQWVNAQVNMFDNYLNNIKATDDATPLRTEIAAKLKESLEYGRFSTPYRVEDYYFFRYNQGTWNQSKLYVLPKCDSKDGHDIDSYLNNLTKNKLSKETPSLWVDNKHVLIDPNRLSKDGTSQLKGIYHSENGDLMAFGISKKGSDWIEIHIKNVKEFIKNGGNNTTDNDDDPTVDTNKSSENTTSSAAAAEEEEKEMIDVLKHCKFTSISWTHDHKGFYYTRYDAPLKKNDKEENENKNEINDDQVTTNSNEKKEEKSKDDDSKNKSLGTETSKLSNQKLYYHKIGDYQKNDKYIIDAITFGDENWLIEPHITHDGKYLIISLSSDCDPVNRVYICQRDDKNTITFEDGSKSILKNMIKLVDNFDAGYDYIFNKNSIFYFKTNFKAPNYRIIKIDIFSKSTQLLLKENKDLNWDEIIKEKEFRLEEARIVGKTHQRLYLDYTKDVKTELYLTSIDGKDELFLINKVKDPSVKENDSKNKEYFPAHGCLGGWGSYKYDCGFIYFSSWLHPGSIYHFNYAKQSDLLLFTQIVPKGFNPNLYCEEQVYFRYKKIQISNNLRNNKFEIIKVSHNKEDLINIDMNNNDDISPIIPMYIMYKKSLFDDKTHQPIDNIPIPTILYGYGGFDISILPQFSSLRLSWLSNFNGIYAVANIRGGGEYGELWHKQGTKLLKQNVFNDFQASATCLIENLKYCNKNTLSIEGGSNGGLLVAACCNQRPDLFKCGIAHVGVLDMLKFDKFTIGYAWVSDYGSSDSVDEFEYLYGYSPLHNIPNPSELSHNNIKLNKNNVLPNNTLEYGDNNDNQYPSFLALTADHDDRVVPLHSFKFMAELQYKFRNYKKQINPLLIRIDLSAGHSGSNLSKAIENKADVYTFTSKALGAKWVNQ